MINVILIAAPAAGKGTEAALLKGQYNIPHISTGDLLRDAIKRKDALGKEIERLISAGQFVSDDIVLNLLKTRILHSDCKNGYILDGFPRNVEQAEAYDNILKEMNKELGIVIVLDIDKEIAKSRISGRLTCPKCNTIYNSNVDKMKPINKGLCDLCNIELTRRADDNPQTYDERYNTYIEKTQPLIDYYNGKGVVYHVDASGTKINTHNQIIKLLEDIND